MNLQDRIKAILHKADKEGIPPVPAELQGVSMDKVREVLAALDLDTADMAGAVYALLDDTRESWYVSAANNGLLFCDGAKVADIGSHIGQLQRRDNMKLDREGRDYWIKPLTNLGAVEKIYLNPKTKSFIPGHPVAKSGNSAYRLADDFKAILQAPKDKWKPLLKQWSKAVSYTHLTLPTIYSV